MKHDLPRLGEGEDLYAFQSSKTDKLKESGNNLNTEKYLRLQAGYLRARSNGN